MTDNELVDRMMRKFDIPLATGVYRDALLYLARKGRKTGAKEERRKVVKYLYSRFGLYDNVAFSIKRKDHLKCPSCPE